MNKNSPNNKLSESKQADTNPGKNKTQQKKNNTQEQGQLAPVSTESIESGHAEPTTAVPNQSAEPKTSKVGKLGQLTHGVWHAPTESKSVAVNSLMTVLTFILALFAYWQWQVSKDSVTVAQKSLEVANATLKDARDSAKEASDRAERMTEANESLAEAAKQQAEASLQISKSSEASAGAAGKSASIAQQALIAGNRAFISIDKMRFMKPLEANQPIGLVYEFANDGNNPAEVSGSSVIYITSALTRCSANDMRSFDKVVVAPKSPRTQRTTIDPLSQQIIDDIKNCDNNRRCKRYIQACIRGSYTTLGKTYPLVNCSYYFPEMDTFMECKK